MASDSSSSRTMPRLTREELSWQQEMQTVQSQLAEIEAKINVLSGGGSDFGSISAHKRVENWVETHSNVTGDKPTASPPTVRPSTTAEPNVDYTSQYTPLLQRHDESSNSVKPQNRQSKSEVLTQPEAQHQVSPDPIRVDTQHVPHKELMWQGQRTYGQEQQGYQSMLSHGMQWSSESTNIQHEFDRVGYKPQVDRTQMFESQQQWLYDQPNEPKSQYGFRGQLFDISPDVIHFSRVCQSTILNPDQLQQLSSQIYAYNMLVRSQGLQDQHDEMHPVYSSTPCKPPEQLHQGKCEAEQHINHTRHETMNNAFDLANLSNVDSCWQPPHDVVVNEPQPINQYYSDQVPYGFNGSSRCTDGDMPVMINIMKQQGDLTKLLLEAQVKSTLPQRSIPTFDGEPLEYVSWIAAFTHGVEDKTTNEKDRIGFLEQHTAGPPQALVRSCMHLPPGTAYIKAKALLKNKYGNKHRLSDAMMTKVKEWPDIKAQDAPALEKFSLFLHECSNTMNVLDMPSELDHVTNIKVLVSKLPYSLQDKWRNLVDYVENQESRNARFNDLVQLLDKQSRIQNNPMYGRIGTSTVKNKTEPQKPKTRAFVTNTSTSDQENSTKKWCLNCNVDTHAMEVCRKLTKLPYSERIEFFKKSGVCFSCLKKAAHIAKDCTNKLKCTVCTGKHPTVLHRDTYYQKNETGGSAANDNNQAEHESQRDNNSRGGENKNSFCGITGAGSHGDKTMQAIVPVLVKCSRSGEVVKTNAMLDEGSDAVFITERLRSKLKVRGKTTKLSLQTLTSDKIVETQAVSGLEVIDASGQHIIEIPVAYTHEDIPVNNYPVHEDLRPWPYLREVELPEIKGSVDILIGNNVPKALEPWKIIHSEGEGPFACKTLLGWVVHGLTKPSQVAGSISVNRVMVEEELSNQMTSMYNTDFVERVICDEPQNSVEDAKFLRMVNSSLRHLDDGHYEIGLPMKNADSVFPSNRRQAEQRISHLKRRFARDDEYKNDYQKFMEGMIENGFAELVPESQVNSSDGRTWFLPHHGVYHPQKKKIRVVFDCGASHNGVSLNDQLLQGPDINNPLIGVLLRFREWPVALMADIQAMFHQVKIPEQDRNLLKFLWWENGDSAGHLREYRMTAHVFGAKSSPSCANYALKQTARDNKDSFKVETIKTLQNNFYVDDCLKSVKSEAEAIDLARELRSVCAEGGFNLVKWISNSREVLESIPGEDRAKEVKMLDFDLPTERALGSLWSAESDKFGYSIAIKDKPPSRRGILSVVSSIYDPLGLVSPAVLPAKKILQDLCKLQTSWDEKIPEKYEKSWNQWLESIPEIENFTQPRCFTPINFGDVHTVQLHHFSDASELGYGTVTYLRFISITGEIHCSLVMGKSRVAPLKQVSIPRLELTAATTAVRVNYMIHKELDYIIDDTFFWTDSTTVLQYIANEKSRYKTFVANRLAVIRDGSEQHQWHYVETWRNPADYCSRGQTVKKFLMNDMWIRGPEFLWSSESEWPVTNVLDTSFEGDPEVKVTCNAIQADEPEEDIFDRLFEHYSDWTRLKRATAWWLKFKQILLNKIRNVNQEERKSLTAQDLQDAEYAIIRQVQKKSFPLEFSLLQQRQNVEAETNDTAPNHTNLKKTSTIANLDPELHDDLLRVGGRLRNAPISIDAKHQIILPKNHPVSRLIIRHAHESVHHQGRNHVIAELRQRYWIIKASAEVRKLVRRCVICRKYQSHLGSQKMADLPATRLQPSEPAFTYTGVDYFGPLMIKKGRTAIKRYGVLFTCMTSRAVHLEVASSLDTSSCIDAIRRFMARRGPVKEFRSDNGTNFVGANAEFKAAFKEINQDQLNNFTSSHGIKWTFNAPAASHHGGVWERQIRTVRKILQSMLQSQFLKTCQSEEQLYTLLCEVEATINSRPLTKASDDPSDLGVLTPNDLLLLRPNNVVPPGKFSSTDVYARQRWKQMQHLADLFWKRWLREYIPDLQRRQKWLMPQRNVMVGDVVMIADETFPRNRWSMGRVIEVFPDKHGFVRQALVKTKTTTLRRPISKLCLLLEADLQNQEFPGESQNDNDKQQQAKTIMKPAPAKVTRTRVVRSPKRLDL